MLPIKSATIASIPFGVFLLAAAADAENHELPGIEELLEMEVTSVAKKPQSITQSAASVFVVTREDIRRSGATSIPEALRLAPGINVGRIGANRWAVSIRGNADRFANKLLVMLDGRTLYTPLFAGVIWETQDLLLEEIERIEVIRGPGAAVWGANAVNGVINIITRHAGDSRGTMFTATLGSEERGTLGIRRGIALGEDDFLRVSAKLRQLDDSVNLHGDPAADDARNLRLDMRWDGIVEGDPVSLSTNYYRGTSKERETLSELFPPWRITRITAEDYHGAAAIGCWQHSGTHGAENRLNGFVDYTHVDLPYLKEQRVTADVEFQRRAPRRGRHEWIWGGAYRNAADDIANAPFTPQSRTLQLFSLFAQDEIELTPERWTLTLGGRLEHNDFTGYELQPNARLLWHPGAEHGVWLSASRATRTPSRAESGMRLRQGTLPPGTAENPSSLPVEIVAFGSPDLDSEVFEAFEAGYRGQWSKDFSMEAVGFIHKYDRLVELRSSVFALQVHPDRIVVPLHAQNIVDARWGSGFELSCDWRPVSGWRVGGAYSYLDSDLEHAPHHLSLRFSHNPGSGIEMDFWMKYVSAYQGALPTPAYTTLDLRLAWQPWRDLELALAGQNLLDEHHLEKEVLLSQGEGAQVERGFYLKVEWRF